MVEEFLLIFKRLLAQLTVTFYWVTLWYRGVAYSWFESYLKDRKEYVSINGFNSKHLSIYLGVPQSSVLGSLLFLIYINDLNNAIKRCKVHHFTYDTNPLHINDSIKKLNEAAHFDLKKN